MGIVAGLAPWLDKCPCRNYVKAAHSFFRRFIQRSAQCTAWVVNNLMKAENKASATTSVGVSCMTNTRRVSKAALLVLPLFLTGCDLEFVDPFPATVADLAGLDPWVAVALVLRGPLYCVGMAFIVKGFVLVKITRKGDYTEIQRADEEDAA